MRMVWRAGLLMLHLHPLIPAGPCPGCEPHVVLVGGDEEAEGRANIAVE